MAFLFKNAYSGISKHVRNTPSLITSITTNVNKYFSNSLTEPYKINPASQQTVVDQNEEAALSKEILRNVNEQVAHGKEGRLFAVVHLCGKQFKITVGDVIIVEGSWPPNIGDEINLNKVLLVGSKDFSLIGRPLVQPGLVHVHATVIEKSLSHTKTHFKKKRREQYMRINFIRSLRTMLRINSIEISGEVNNPPEVQSLKSILL